uniref:Regulator of G-protein signaling 1 n=1 Tax=Rhizophora mucronata TaxID=61149 RepID=A0A2P2JV90_RHIMU
MAGCAVGGGCPTDYTAIVIATLSIILLLWRLSVPFVVHKVPRTNGSGFWIPVIQVLGSFNLLLSIVISVNFRKFKRAHWWQSCYFWAGKVICCS